jgi:hypothetical protein
MPDLILQVPMRESVTISVGQTLTIHFTQSCCFCCDEDKINSFKPPLPVGDQDAGDVWSGAALGTGTVNFWFVTSGTPCGAAPVTKAGVATGGRTIIVGS